MGRRTNPLSLRVRGLLNWGSSVRHPLLSAYVRHVFQGHSVSVLGIRASTSGLFVNATVLGDASLSAHPKLSDPSLRFDSVKVVDALGRGERRIAEFGGSESKNEYHKMLWDQSGVRRTQLVKERTQAAYQGSSPLLARAQEDGVLDALHIYRNYPIHLQINVIKNPILNADVLAQYVAKQLKSGAPLPKVYKSLLGKLTAES
ncbi:hypothetical protein BC830DRAFT_1153441 [Chytriomyces sp. MP71]|nr:hypothetical protein BC830DRAFT_1153441 [Chytriomyces sp. MP71]